MHLRSLTRTFSFCKWGTWGPEESAGLLNFTRIIGRRVYLQWGIHNGSVLLFRVLLHLRRFYPAGFGCLRPDHHYFSLSLTHGTKYALKSVLVYTPALSIWLLSASIFLPEKWSSADLYLPQRILGRTECVNTHEVSRIASRILSSLSKASLLLLFCNYLLLPTFFPDS